MLQSLLYKRGVDMRKKVIGGIVLGVVTVACLAALIVSKETKDDEKIIPEKDIKKVERFKDKIIGNVDDFKINIKLLISHF